MPGGLCTGLYARLVSVPVLCAQNETTASGMDITACQTVWTGCTAQECYRDEIDFVEEARHDLWKGLMPVCPEVHTVWVAV